MIFCGVDTSICVETSLREAFNLGYDVMLISDATASGNEQHYATTLERVGNYYGVVMNFDRFRRMIDSLAQLNSSGVEKIGAKKFDERISAFFEEFGLLDIRKTP